jgi:hypothetical protein
MKTNPLAAAFATISQLETTYYAELGRMIAFYARAEASVHMLARHFSGLPEAKARAVFGGMRLADLTDRIRQMMRIDGVPDKTYKEVDACLVQLGTVANERHKLVHRSVDYAGEYLTVSNIFTAKSFAAIERTSFSDRDLKNMSVDCGCIFLRLIAVITPDAPHNQDPEVQALAHAPWRYKPSPPTSPKGRRQKA